MNIVGKIYPFNLNSELQCAQLGKKIAQLFITISPRKYSLNIGFIGDLGSGKTTLIRSIFVALGYQGKVKSPTYNLCEPYTISIKNDALTIHHFDLYRMNHPLEWEEAGFKDIFDHPGINLIEWPDRAENTLPPADISIFMDYVSETVRKGHLQGQTPLGIVCTELMYKDE